MNDSNDIRVYGPNFNEFTHSLTKAMNSVPNPVTKRLRQIYSAYFSRGAFNLIYKKMNDRTVAQILAEFDGTSAFAIRSGEIDGVKFRLYDAPKDANSSTEE
jgi:hypothetical protein